LSGGASFSLVVSPSPGIFLAQGVAGPSQASIVVVSSQQHVGSGLTLNAFFYDRALPYLKSHKRSWKLDVGLYRGHLEPAIGSILLCRITPLDLIGIQSKGLELGYAKGTINRWLVLARHLLNLAIRWDVIASGKNPMAKVPLLPDNARSECYLTKDQLKLLLSEMQYSENPDLGNIVLLLLLTGARKREILDARWDCVCLLERMLTVPLSKSGKPRHIRLSEASCDLISSLPRLAGSPWLFPNPKTERPYRSIFYSWDTLRKKVGLPELRMHDLRHSFASFLVNSGHSLYEVQQLLGHSNPRTTMRYAHLSSETLLRVTESVATIVSSAQA